MSIKHDTFGDTRSTCSKSSRAHQRGRKSEGLKTVGRCVANVSSQLEANSSIQAVWKEFCMSENQRSDPSATMTVASEFTTPAVVKSQE